MSRFFTAGQRYAKNVSEMDKDKKDLSPAGPTDSSNPEARVIHHLHQMKGLKTHDGLPLEDVLWGEILGVIPAGNCLM